MGAQHPAVLHGLGNVRQRSGLCPRQVGNGAGNLERAVGAAG